MNKHILLGACLLSLLAAGCSNEDAVYNTTDVNHDKDITLQAIINNGTRMTYTDNETERILKFAWSMNESFKLYCDTESNAYKFYKTTEGNTFKGRIKNSDKYYAVYGDGITNNNGLLTVNIASQTGNASENGVTTFMVAENSDISQNFCFNHKLTVLKLNLTLPEGITETIVNKVSVVGLHNQATYNLAKGCYDTYNDNCRLPIEAINNSTGFAIGSDRKITAYVAVFPENVKANAVTFKAETAQGLYYYTMATGRELVAGKMVRVNVTLKKVEHEYVNLGLPSGTLWATMNIGAVSAEDYGDYFAWGETDTKEDYSWIIYMCTQDQCGTNNDVLEGIGNIGDTYYDVARKKWSGKWTMPTYDQFNELLTKCTWTEHTTDGVFDGYTIAGSNGMSIFLPAAGYRDGSLAKEIGSNCDYWSASSDDNVNSFSLSFPKSTSIFSESRYRGLSIRPVYITRIPFGTTDLEDSDDSQFNN